MLSKELIHEKAAELHAPMKEFAKKIIRLRSDTGKEKEVADAIFDEATKLGYDEVVRDRTGNIVAILKGDNTGDSLMFNCHMDQVDPGDLSVWPYDPFGGVEADGFIHGRGASDTKGAIATQLYAGALVKKLGVKLAGDLIFTFVVEEEPGDMWGMIRLSEDWLKDRRPAFCISGEATGGDFAMGHRGRVEIQVISKGKNSHSSAPWLGINAVSKMAPMIEALDKMAEDLPSDDIFKGSMSIIAIECHPGFNCVVPDTCTINLDRRFTTNETVEQILDSIRELAEQIKKKDPEADYEVRVRKLEHTSYTGVHEFGDMIKPAYITPDDNPYVQKARSALNKLGKNPKTYYWDFGTDAAYISNTLGIPVVGYSPAEEKYCHQPIDRISIALMEEVLEGYAAICIEIAGK